MQNHLCLCYEKILLLTSVIFRGYYRYSSTQLDGLFAGENKVWSFAPQISIPIFQAGKLKSALKLAEVRKSVAVVEYEKAIRTAFKEVADGLAGGETYDRQIQAQQRVVMASNRRVSLSALRYKAGLDGSAGVAGFPARILYGSTGVVRPET